MSQTEVQLIKTAAVVTADIADQAVTLDKLPHGTSSNNGKFLRANNGADPTFETISSDLVGDTSPQLGGDLDTNSFEIMLDDAHKIKFGDGNDLTIQHSGNHAFIDNLTGNIYIRNDGSNDDSEIHIMARNDEESIVCHDDGAVDVYHNGGKKFSSHSNGLSIKNEAGGSSSSLFIFGPEGESAEIQMNADDGDDNADYFRLIHVASDNSWRLQNYGGGSWATNIEANSTGNVELYHNGSKKLETTSIGNRIPDDQYLGLGDSDDLNIRFLNGTGAFIQSGANNMYIRSNLIELGDNSGHKYIKCIDAGAVELYHGVDSKKLETTSAGISVTGQVTASVGAYGLDANDYLQFTNNDQLNIYLNNNNEFRFEADGDFHADGDVIAFSTTTASDENLKDNITTITDAVTKVEAIKGVTYTWKKDNSKSAGVIAQDVQKILPEVVKTVSNLDGNEYLAVNYGGLTSILVEAIKDLSARLKVLEAK